MSQPDAQLHRLPALPARSSAEISHELGVFRRFAVEMISIHSEEALLWHVARNVVGRMNFSDCVVYAFDPVQNVLQQVAAIGDKAPAGIPDLIVNRLTIPLGKGITGTVAQSGKPLIIDDLTKDARYIPDISEAGSEICVPILNGTELLGVIDCEHPQPYHFGPSALAMLTSVAALTAAQIIQCRMILDSQSTRRQLARALEVSELAQHGQNRFLANASHELRTPLNAIIGFSSLLTRPGYFGADPERGEMQATTILDAGRQLAAMVEDMLEITAVAGGRVKPAPECLDIGWECEEALRGFNTSLDEPEISIEPVSDPKLLQASCDVRHFRKIVGKLTSVALAVSTEGCPVSVRIGRDADCIVIAICSGGAKLDAAPSETGFTPFDRESASTCPGVKETGLDLTLARELAQANLAEIRLASRPGNGCEFALRLPAFVEPD